MNDKIQNLGIIESMKDVYWDSARKKQVPKEIDAEEQQERRLQVINDKE